MVLQRVPGQLARCAGIRFDPRNGIFMETAVYVEFELFIRLFRAVGFIDWGLDVVEFQFGFEARLG